MGKEKKVVQTNWTKATTSISVAMANLINCIEHGNNAWLEIRDNGDQECPIMQDNPALNNPFNWKACGGILRTDKNIGSLLTTSFCKSIRENLTLNYTGFFGEEEAIKLYQEKGEITDKLNTGMGVPHPVLITDAIEWAKKFRGNIDPEIYKQWVCMWTPKDDVPYNILAYSVGKVFVVCYDNNKSNKAESLKKTAKFLFDYANSLKK